MTKQELLNISKPILFNTEMVKAVLEGRKTVTRRVVKPKFCDSVFEMYKGVLCETEPKTPPVKLENGMMQHKVRPYYECNPRYKAGDILYVRETFVKADDGYHYRADATPDSERLRKDYGYRYCPSIHMPNEAARIFLRVTDVKVERLQNITSTDIYNEGIDLTELEPISVITHSDYLYAFNQLWDSTVKKQDFNKYGWDANPYVFVYEFEREKIDE